MLGACWHALLVCRSRTLDETSVSPALQHHQQLTRQGPPPCRPLLQPYARSAYSRRRHAAAPAAQHHQTVLQDQASTAAAAVTASLAQTCPHCWSCALQPWSSHSCSTVFSTSLPGTWRCVHDPRCLSAAALLLPAPGLLAQDGKYTTFEYTWHWCFAIPD